MCKVIAILILTALPVFAETSDRIVIRENVSQPHRDEIATKLREITGWKELGFRKDGVLQIGTANPENGSKSARSLLTRAVSVNKLIVLEDASSRAEVAFCRVVPARWINGDSARPPAYVIFIDFTDFQQIVGDKQARESFHVGWGVLHEIDHVVSETKDSEVDGDLGECEVHINRMRDELGLPLRANYFLTASPLKTDPNFNSRFVRLPFERRDTSSSRTKRYWLTWDATVVGGLTKSNQSASVRALIR